MNRRFAIVLIVSERLPIYSALHSEHTVNDSSLRFSYEKKNNVDEDSDEDTFTEDRYRQIAKMLPHDAKQILDIGCSAGMGGRVLSSLRSTLLIDGLDCVQDRVNALPPAYRRGICGLSTQIPVDDGSYDVVVAGEFLEHLYPADVDITLCEMQRVLRIGGRLILTTPNPGYIKHRLTGSSVYCSYHLTQHPPEVLRLRLAMHGFAHIRFYGSGRVSKYLGAYFPIKAAYGSYLLTADKR
jgi:SAM-dependent methyltransferase